MNNAEKPMALWFIELKVECPKCMECVDLTRTGDFWHRIKIKTHENLETYCPECGHEFIVDCEFG